MSLGKRVSLIVLLTLAMLLVTMSLFVDRFIVQEFRAHDTATLQRHIERVQGAFKNMEQQLAAKMIDWAQWDDSYEFIQSGNPQYIHENLNFLTLSALGLQHMVYFDSAGNPAYPYEVFPREERVASVPSATLETLRTAPLAQRASDTPTTGLLQLGQSLVLFASSPILDSKREKEARGTLLGTVAINPAMLKTLAEQTNLSLSALRIGVDQIGAIEADALNKLTAGGKTSIREVNQDLLHGYGLLNDSNGKPVLLFRVDKPRTSYQQALNLRHIMRASLVVAGLLWAALALWLLNRWILGPITRLSAEVREIARAGNSELNVSEWDRGHSLKLRALVIIGTTMLLLTATLSYLFSQVLTAEFEQIERTEMTQHVQRALQAVNERADTLRSKAIDWGQWDDTYQFVLDRNKDYSEANLIYETLGAIGMSHVLFFDTQHELVTGRVVDFENESVSAATPAEGAPFKAFVRGASEPKSGYVALDSGILMVALSPILDTTRTKNSRGAFVFAMPMGSALSAELAKQTELELAFATPGQVPAHTQAINMNDGISLLVHGSSSITGRVPLVDATGKELLSIEVNSERQIYQQGKRAQQTLLLWLIAASVVFLAVTLWALHRWVIKRVSDLKQGLLGGTIDPEHPAAALEEDELATLSKDINGMLAALNQAQAELIEARDAAEAANHAKSSFIAKVSHELRTPIHSIIGMLRIVLKQESNQSRRTHLGMARDATYALLETINDILDFSKAEAGMLSVNPVEFDLNQVLRETLRTIAPRIYERESLEFLCEVEPSIPTHLVGDPVRLKQILVNLIGNSAKFTNSGDVKLKLQAKALDTEHATLCFEVSDTGIGIAPERLASIFEPFTQADNSTVRQYQGTGLGLTIVKQLVETMGGEITATSEVERGSTFTLEVPFERVRSASEQDPICRLDDKIVIILDHVPRRRDSLRQLLLQNGAAEVWETITPDLARPQQSEIVLLATGEMLMQRDNWEFVKKFRRTYGSARIVTLHTPNQLTLREELETLDVAYMLNRPTLPRDILGALNGTLVVESHEDERELDQVPNYSRRLRVLIADDTPTNLIILRDLLEESNHEVTSVTNGQELLGKLVDYLSEKCEAPFDLILSDVQMPQMDGVTAVEYIRDSERSQRIPIVMVTAHAFPEERVRLLEAGADDVVTKPIEPEELHRALHKVMRGRVQATDTDTDSTTVEAPTAQVRADLTPEEQLLEIANAALRAEHLTEALEAARHGTQLIDIEELLRRSGKNARRSLRIMGAFIEGHASFLDNLQTSRENHDAESLHRAAHALKGLLLDAGAHNVADVAAAVERLSREGKLSEAEALALKLEHETQLVARLASEIHTVASTNIS